MNIKIISTLLVVVAVFQVTNVNCQGGNNSTVQTIIQGGTPALVPIAGMCVPSCERDEVCKLACPGADTCYNSIMGPWCDSPSKDCSPIEKKYRCVCSPPLLRDPWTKVCGLRCRMWWEWDYERNCRHRTYP